MKRRTPLASPLRTESYWGERDLVVLTPLYDGCKQSKPVDRSVHKSRFVHQCLQLIQSAS